MASLSACRTTIVDTGEVFDCVIVGGGISGLAAALFFLRKSGRNRTCLVLDNHPVFGGEAKRNEFVVDGHRLMAHQGSAVFFVQYPHSFLGRFYDSIGLKDASTAISEVGRSSEGDDAQQDALRHGGKRAGDLRIVFWREIWPRSRACG